MQLKKINYQSGQALLITVLVLTVAITITLSLIGRGTVDVNISSQIEESSRAFNAAEAGIEESLESGLSITTQVLSPGVNYSVDVANVGAVAGLYKLIRKTPHGVTDMVWLVNHNADGSLNEAPVYVANTIKICWSQETAGNRPALIIALLLKDNAGVYKVLRTAVDPDPSSRANTNQFDSTVDAVANGCGLTNYYQKTLNFTTMGSVASDTRLALRIRPEYADTFLAVDTGAVVLPKQGNRLESTGTTDSGVSRKVIVYELYRSPPSIFDYVIYNQSGDFVH